MLLNDRVRQESALRDAVLAGDAAAWRVLYDGAYSGLWAYVSWRFAGLRELAEDVTQETWLIAVRRMREFEPGRGRFLAWLAASRLMCSPITCACAGVGRSCR